ncbi:ABC transporter substrate-binding protein [uncultured Demequina sp.]|uniref:ABC transporter substrate-binding protein n=1 Tax=uncultured Demequina sp. TaxID=693499 RepID=UPI0025DEFBCF|nr:ABC transporter substrate-binding protein [uncultured Demequina sp.]
MARWNTIARGAAFAAAASLALAACSSDGGSDDDATSGSGSEGGSTDPLKIGTLLPLTGSLAFLGPPEVAGVELAAQEINEAGGVLGNPVEVTQGDSSDTQNTQIASQTVTDLLSDGVSAIIGAASSAVTLNVVDDIVAAEVMMVSPANTATTLSGYDPFYARVAPPDTVQGNALAQLMLDDGHENIGILVFNEDYGTSLRDVIKDTVEAAGGTITYGNPGEEFDPAATNFQAEVDAVLATEPDAIALIAFDQTTQILDPLITGGLDAANLYMTDGNTADYNGEVADGLIEGAQGTIPGANPDDDFKARLDEVHGETLDSYAYGAESYDATMLVALAAVRGGGTDGPTIQANIAAVSGSEGGTECSTFADCVELLESGEEIAFQTVGGSGPLNEANDPSSAYIGVYSYDANNTQNWVEAVFGEVPS